MRREQETKENELQLECEKHVLAAEKQMASEINNVESAMKTSMERQKQNYDLAFQGWKEKETQEKLKLMADRKVEVIEKKLLDELETIKTEIRAKHEKVKMDHLELECNESLSKTKSSHQMCSLLEEEEKVLTEDLNDLRSRATSASQS